MNYADLVRVLTAATGTGSSITLGAAYSQLFLTPTEAGMLDGGLYSYSIIDGNNFELGRGIYTAAGTSLSRDTIIKARESGTLTNAKITLSGTAQVRILQLAEDIGSMTRNRTVTGTTDTLTNAFLRALTTYNSASSVAAGIGQALSSNGFPSGWNTELRNINTGTVTITPTMSTINGAASITLKTNEAVRITSDGTNWNADYMVRTSVNGQSGALTIYQPPQIRMTVTQNVAITTADVTAATSLYFEPFNGSTMSVYDGTANWVQLPVAANTYSLPATQSQNGNRASTSNAIISGLTDTSQLIAGMQISGTGIGASSVIVTVDSSTQVTGSVNNTGTGSGTSVTFKLPPSTNYDVYATNNSGVPKFLWSAPWSNDTTPPTRAVQNGFEVASGATTKLLVGSARTTSVAGQLEDSHTHRFVSNRYNEQPRSMYAVDPAGSWPYSLASYRQANNNTANQLDYIVCVPRPIWAHAQSLVVMSTPGTASAVNCNVNIGIDTASGGSAQLVTIANLSGTTYVPTSATYTGTPGIGRHFVTWLEFGSPGVTPSFNTIETWLATAANNLSGIIGEVAN